VALASQGVVSEEASAKILALAGDLFAGKVSADDAKKALLDLGTAEPDTSGITTRLVNLIATLDAVRNGAISAFNATASVAGTPASFAGQDTYKPPVKTVSLADLKKPGTGTGGSKKTPGEKFSDSLDSQRERTRFLEEEIALQRTLNPLVNDYGFALERLKTQRSTSSPLATPMRQSRQPSLQRRKRPGATPCWSGSISAKRQRAGLLTIWWQGSRPPRLLETCFNNLETSCWISV
jgi:hypothetical protein